MFFLLRCLPGFRVRVGRRLHLRKILKQKVLLSLSLMQRENEIKPMGLSVSELKAFVPRSSVSKIDVLCGEGKEKECKALKYHRNINVREHGHKVRKALDS